VVARLIDPAPLWPHRFMPPCCAAKGWPAADPRPARSICGIPEDRTRQPHTRDASRPPAAAKYRAILAGVQAVRPRCAAGAPPGPEVCL